ncbi:MAG: hypothetical protein AB8H80_05095 [Planctomycetota bacterium]
MDSAADVAAKRPPPNLAAAESSDPAGAAADDGAPYPLAKPGILLAMLSPEPADPEAASAGDPRRRGSAAEPFASEADVAPSRPATLIAHVMLGSALGALAAALITTDRSLMESGHSRGALGALDRSWLDAVRGWLPASCIGFGVARLMTLSVAATVLLRLAIAGVVALLAVHHLAANGAGFLSSSARWLDPLVTEEVRLVVLGAFFGLVPGLAWRRLRSIGGFAALLLAVVAGSVCLLLMPMPRSDAAVLALLATLVTLLPRRRPRGQPFAEEPTPLGFWRGCVWLLLLVVGVGAVVVYGSGIAPIVGVVAVAFGSLWLAALATNRLGLAVGAALAIVALAWGWAPRQDVFAGSRFERELYRRAAGDVRIVYRRADQELQRRVAGEATFAVGPDRNEAPLLAAALHAFVRPGDRVLALGSGAERCTDSLARRGCSVIDHLDARALSGEASWLMLDGPVPSPERQQSKPADGGGGGGVQVHAATLGELAAGSRQVLLVADCFGVAATRHRATPTFQRELRRVAGSGLVLQVAALDRAASAPLEAWFAAACQEHRHSELFVVGDAAVLASFGSAKQAETAWQQSTAETDSEARWALYRAHLGGLADLRRARVGRLGLAAGTAPAGVVGGGLSKGGLASGPDANDGASLPDVAAVLGRWLQLEAPPLPAAVSAHEPAGSTLAHWRSRRAALRRAHARLSVLADDAESRHRAHRLAREMLPFGAPGPLLQAALGLPDEDGVTLLDPQQAVRCAYAIDPTSTGTFGADTFRADKGTQPSGGLPPVFRPLPRPTEARGDLEDLHRVASDVRLVRRCVGAQPLAVALRARFGGRCARALIAQLAIRALRDDEQLALRELADPFVLAEAARVLAEATAGGSSTGQQRELELLPIWRRDLPAPSTLVASLRGLLQAGSVDQREAVVRALWGRMDPSCYGLIAELLLDEEPALRRSAGQILKLSVGDRVEYEANWPRSRRVDAATQLRALHNRRP